MIKMKMFFVLSVITTTVISIGTITGTNTYGISAEGAVHLNHSFNIGYEDIAETDRPVFCFDFPDGWAVSRKETSGGYKESTPFLSYMAYYDEIVELTNNRGVCITYTRYNMEPGLVGNGSAFHYTMEYLVEKVAESELNQEGLMVAE